MHSAGAVTPPHSIFHVWKRLLPRDFSLIFTFTFTGWCSAPAPQHFSLIFTFTFTFTAVHWSIGPEILQYNSSHHELNVDGSRISGSTAGSRLQVEREKFEGRFEQILGRRRCQKCGTTLEKSFAENPKSKTNSGIRNAWKVPGSKEKLPCGTKQSSNQPTKLQTGPVQASPVHDATKGF